ncbi:phenylacetate--CoA ligase family protein [Paenibacillus solani]|uniref:phenylacetate--CoA ligase family protein n=1 Tax=Paenibacillus solani TaxID=1705565 RepID=UPI003D2E2D76
MNSIARANPPQTQVMGAVLHGEKTHIQSLSTFFDNWHDRGTTIEYVSPEEVQEYHLHALNLTLQYVWDNNTYYRDQLIQAGFDSPRLDSLQDLGRIPFLIKDTLQGDKNKLLCCDSKKIGQVHTTSGTTGQPLYLSYSLADQFIHEFIPKYTTLFDDHEDDVVGIALPYEFSQAALGFQRLYQFIYGATVLSLGKGGYLSTIDKTLDILKAYNATILITTPSYASILAEECEKLGIVLGEDIRLKKIWITGEGCSPQFRNRLEDWWKCPVHFLYGSTEIGVIGVECPEHHGYHLAEGHVKVEVIDIQSGEPLAYGEVGEIVMTSLLKEAMPFIRYRTGDIGYLEKSNCSLGIQLDTLHLRGRLTGQLEIDGKPVSPMMLEHFLMEVADISMWYHFILDEEGFTIEVEPFKTDLSEEEIAEKVQRHMRQKVGLDFRVKVTSQLPRTYSKVNRIIRKQN